MNRRRFLQAIAAVPLAAWAAHQVPKTWVFPRAIRNPETGMAIRFIRHWDSVHGEINRFDTLAGFGKIYPSNFAVRITGNGKRPQHSFARWDQCITKFERRLVRHA